MNQDRFTNLAIILIEKDIKVDLEKFYTFVLIEINRKMKPK